MTTLVPGRPGGFSGQFDLRNLAGIYWNDYIQTGALELKAKNDGVVGGADRVKILCDGSAITFSSNYTWVNLGTNVVGDIVAANTIVFAVWKVSDTELNYVIKIIT